MEELIDQVRKVVSESNITTLLKHKAIMRVLIDLRFELEAERMEERENAKHRNGKKD